VVEDLALALLGAGDEMLVENAEDVGADVGELGLDLLAVRLDLLDLGRVSFGLLLLLDRRDNTPRGTASANDIPVYSRTRSKIAWARGAHL
jgi:hypothetical protein